jgi:hypothetical protein
MSEHVLREVGKALERPNPPGSLGTAPGVAGSTPPPVSRQRDPRRTGRPLIVLDASALVELSSTLGREGLSRTALQTRPSASSCRTSRTSMSRRRCAATRETAN